MPLGNHIADLDGLLIGHATDLDLGSGVTAVIFAEPAVVSVAVLGGAPGGRELGLLAPEMTIERVDAVVLAGGSAFGLDAAAGVQAALREDGRGLKVAGATVPLVPAAILFDLANGGSKEWGRFPPYRDLGHAAARAARAAAGELGSIGAGTGASTATVKGGIGSASARTPSGHLVGAIAAVNALGTATIGDGPHFWAAPFEVGAEFGGRGWPARFTPADTALRLKSRPQPGTTIGLVATDATLSKAQAKRLAIMAHDGLARAVLPAHAPGDGDTIFAAATGRRPLREPVAELTELGHAAAAVFARAIGRAVFCAAALPHKGAQPAWRDRFGA
ncbi:MAG: P1 family peptidase [Alphaproteobacteria bacterium]|nr:P1 family peptidase [Alphaproteobacteria bacterium]